MGATFGRATVYLSLLIGFLGLADFAFADQDVFPLYYISPAIRLPEFFLGMVLGAALRRRPVQPAASALVPWLAGVAVLAASMNHVYKVGLWTRANIIVVPALAWLIYATACHERSRQGAPRGRAWRLLHYLGEASYSLFVVQMPFLLWFDHARKSGGAIARWAAELPVATWCTGLTIALLVSVGVHEIVEKPLRRWLLARFAQNSPA